MRNIFLMAEGKINDRSLWGKKKVRMWQVEADIGSPINRGM